MAAQTPRPDRCAALRRLLPALILAAAGCATNPGPGISPAVPTRERVSTLTLHGKPLELHLSVPTGGAKADALVLYASGDGGWFGTAIDMFRRIGRAGYYTVGFSSRTFLRIDRPKGTRFDPRQLTVEYRQIVGAARAALGLGPDTPVVLTGWSRGASFAVLAASRWPSSERLQGVVAIGLGEGEDLQVSGADNEPDDETPTQNRRRWPFELYSQLAKLGTLHYAVIQATGDQYLGASRAHALFGVDTNSRRFYEIEAKNHRFAGGKPAFERALLDAVAWITSN